MSLFGKLAGAAIGTVQDKVNEIETKTSELRLHYLERLTKEESELPYIYRVRFKESLFKTTRSRITVFDEAGALIAEGRYGGLDGDFNMHSADIETTSGHKSGRIKAERTKEESPHHYYLIYVGEENEQRLEEHTEDVSSFKNLKTAVSYIRYKLTPKGWMLVSDFKEGMLLQKDTDVPSCVYRVFDDDGLFMRIDVPRRGSKAADGFHFIIRCVSASESALLYGVLLSIALSHSIDRYS